MWYPLARAFLAAQVKRQSQSQTPEAKEAPQTRALRLARYAALLSSPRSLVVSQLAPQSFY